MIQNLSLRSANCGSIGGMLCELIVGAAAPRGRPVLGRQQPPRLNQDHPREAPPHSRLSNLDGETSNWIMMSRFERFEYQSLRSGALASCRN
jgi:hypothetical protein